MTALIIDDEVQIRRLLRMALESRGYVVREAEAGQLGLQEAVFHKPDVILLDLGLPDMDGVAVLRRLREWSDVPVLILSVRDQESVKIAAFDAGADDYVTKPFSTAELVARLSAIQRRRFTQQSPVFQTGALMLDIAHHEASLAGEPLKLTPTEFALLKVLVEKRRAHCDTEPHDPRRLGRGSNRPERKNSCFHQPPAQEARRHRACDHQ